MLSAMGSCLSVGNGLLYTDVFPGDDIHHELTVMVEENETATEVTAGLFGHGMGLDGSRILTEDDEEARPYSAVGFLKITPENATLNPGEPVVFVIEGKIPEDVGSGGRYALANITLPPNGDSNKGIAIVLEQLIPIMLTISGSDMVETGEITKINFSDDIISVVFKNTGNHHFKASCEATVKNENGDVISDVAAPLMYTSLVPPASWLFNMPIDAKEELAPGNYTISAKVIKSDGSLLDSKEEVFEF